MDLFPFGWLRTCFLLLGHSHFHAYITWDHQVPLDLKWLYHVDLDQFFLKICHFLWFFWVWPLLYARGKYLIFFFEVHIDLTISWMDRILKKSYIMLKFIAFVLFLSMYCIVIFFCPFSIRHYLTRYTYICFMFFISLIIQHRLIYCFVRVRFDFVGDNVYYCDCN